MSSQQGNTEWHERTLSDVLASAIWMLVPGLMAGLVLATAGARLVQVIVVGVSPGSTTGRTDFIRLITV